jgi:hypothetical protein
VAEEGQGGGGGGPFIDGRGPMGIESAASGAPLNLWCASFQEGEAMD